MSTSLSDNPLIPSFSFTATPSHWTSSEDLKGHFVILYFYPKDHTPGCTREAEDFKRYYADFQKHGAYLLGVSRDTLARHAAFIQKYSLPFPLIADEKGTLCTLFGVLKEKTLFGKLGLGVERATFLINPTGHVIARWHHVKVKGHAKEVLDTLEEYLKKNPQ